MERPRLHRKFAAANEEVANAVHSTIEESQEFKPDQDTPIHFRDNFSGTSVKLPPISAYPEELLTLIRMALIDIDMESDLKQQQVLNWFPRVQALLPILTPNDGNCLLHAISIAVWGVPDDFSTLRRTLNAEMVRDYQKKQMYFKRWSLHGKLQDCINFGGSVQNSMDRERDFQDVMKRASPQPIGNTAVPHAFLEPIHIYVMANILRRPIIVIADSSARSLNGMSLQESDMGGIYLPLEWQPSECRRVPVLLAYNMNHFSPLLAQEVLDRSRPSPIMAVSIQLSDFSFLPVKFAMEEEERSMTILLKRYLILQEVPRTSGGDKSLSLILVAMMDGQPPAQDVVTPYFQNCERQYQAFNSAYAYTTTATTNASQGQQGSAVPPQPAPAPAAAQAQPRLRPEQVTAHPSNEAYYNAGEETRVTGAAPRPATFEAVAVQTAGGLGLGGETQSMLFQGSKCTTPGCEFYASQATGMKCSKCLEKITIEESRRNPRHPAILPVLSTRTQPSAPAPSVPLESPASMMSMMSQNCANRCGYRCSSKTFPYCHECAELNWSRRQVPPSAPEAPPSTPLEMPQAQGLPVQRQGQQQSEEELFGTGQVHTRLSNFSLSPASPNMPTTPATPGTPTMPGSGSGMPFDRCSTPGCMQQGCQNCEGKCVGCYIRGTPTMRVAAGDTARLQSQSSYNSEVAQAMGGALPTGNVPQAFTTTPLSPSKGPSAVACGQTGAAHDPMVAKIICSTPGCQGVRMKNEFNMCLQCYRKNSLPMVGGMESQGKGLTDMSLEQRPSGTQDLIESGNSDYCGTRKAPPPTSPAGKQPMKRKCAGPACSVMLYSRELCDQCMAVLQQHRAVHGGRDLPQRQISAPATHQTSHEVKKPGQCLTPNCTFFGTQGSGFCSSCSKKAILANLSAPVLRSSPVEGLPARNSTAPVGKGRPCIVEGCARFGDPSNDDMCTKCWHYNRQRVMMEQTNAIRHKPVQASLDPAVALNHSFPPYPFSSQPPTIPTPSRSPSEEENFSFFNRLEDRSRTNRRCKQRKFACPNFGNSHNTGLCNSCFKSRQQELLCLEQHG